MIAKSFLKDSVTALPLVESCKKGFKYSRKDEQGRSSSSTDVSPADVEMPPPASPLSPHPPAKRTSNGAREKHKLCSHFPEDPNCEVCTRTKLTRAPCRRNPDDRADRIKIAERLGDMVTAHHKVLKEDQESRMHHTYAVVVQDLATHWIQSYLCKTKSAQETQRSLRTILHPEENPRCFWLMPYEANMDPKDVRKSLWFKEKFLIKEAPEEGISTVRSKGPEGEAIERTYDYVVASTSLQNREHGSGRSLRIKTAQGSYFSVGQRQGNRRSAGVEGPVALPVYSVGFIPGSSKSERRK